jgi:hypothetical protein
VARSNLRSSEQVVSSTRRQRCLDGSGVLIRVQIGLDRRVDEVGGAAHVAVSNGDLAEVEEDVGPTRGAVPQALRGVVKGEQEAAVRALREVEGAPLERRPRQVVQNGRMRREQFCGDAQLGE